MQRFLATFLVQLLTFGLLVQAAPPMPPGPPVPPPGPAVPPGPPKPPGPPPPGGAPVQHLVVIFQENISFDHYFATYPTALNLPGEPVFTALPDTPSVNGLSGGLLSDNPNALNTAINGTGAVNPFRLSRAQAATNDQGHNYMPEQMAFHGGLMDQFPFSVGTAGPPPGSPAQALTKGQVMAYFDGNTVTALWNYAQRFAMSDNSYNTTFGPSTPGAINLISGQTNGVINNVKGTGGVVADGNGGLTDIGDADPTNDVCSTPTGETFQMAGRNVGDMLNGAGITWGFYEGGFDLSVVNSDTSTGCNRTTTSLITNSKKVDYIPHHQPFQYYPSTANPTHARPNSVSSIGFTDPANHQYDTHDFFDAVSAGNYPAVNFLKAPGFQDGHAGYSDPLDEQQFVVQVINFLQQKGDWEHTVVIIAYDDSDGWYDHQMSPIVNQSATSQDALLGSGSCGAAALAMAGVNSGTLHAQGRCGYGPRLPLLVISPWAKQNFVDHTVTDQSSILRFIEDTWLKGERIGQGSFDAVAGPLTNMFDFSGPPNKMPYLLDGVTGEVASPR